jgi:CheY-like chemotaxis protein
MYAVHLSCVGFDVIEASNGVEALERAAASAPDVVVMDLSLPIMDGWEATRRLRADARTTRIPVIVLTGHALTGNSDAAKNLTCDAFVVKPCLPEALEREIRRLLEQTAGRA